MKQLVYASVIGFCALSFSSYEYIPIQERAQGQSLTGGHMLNDSIFSNPAASAFVQAYTLDGSFLPPKTFAVSVLDTKTSSVGGGLGYFRVNDADGFEPLHGGKLSLVGRVSNVVGLGVAGKLIWGPMRDTDGNKMAESGRMTDADVGMTAYLGGVQLGAVIKNALGGDASLGFKREVAAGARLNYDKILYLSVAAHALASEVRPFQYSAGVEYMSPYYISAKGGYRILPYEGSGFWSAGASFISPMLSLHYAVEFPQDATSLDHHLGATMSF